MKKWGKALGFRASKGLGATNTPRSPTHDSKALLNDSMMLAASRSLAQARPHLGVAWRQQRAPLLAAARTWSSSSSSSTRAAAGLWVCSNNQRRGGDVVCFGSGFVARSPVAAAGAGGRTTKLRNVFVEAKKEGKKSGGGGGGGGAGKGKKEAAVANVDKDYDDDDLLGEDEDDDDLVFEEEEDELMQTDENGELISTGDEDIDVEEAIFTAGTEWGELALKSLQGVMEDDEFESVLEIFSFRVSLERRRIYISVDNVTDKFGSPSMDQLISVSKKFNAVLEETGGFPDDVALEVASPGAERQMRLPGDLKRFRDLTMRVTYTEAAEGDEGQTTPTTKVMLLTDLDEEQGESTWKLADVVENRPQAKKGQGMNKKQREMRLKLPIGDITKANLFIDI